VGHHFKPKENWLGCPTNIVKARYGVLLVIMAGRHAFIGSLPRPVLLASCHAAFP
jgi:hypothetical protein